MAAGPSNLLGLLQQRELGLRRQRPQRCGWGAPQTSTSSALATWAEADSLGRCSASYYSLHPEPRSTIAAAFSPDGALLASTQ